MSNTTELCLSMYQFKVQHVHLDIVQFLDDIVISRNSPSLELCKRLFSINSVSHSLVGISAVTRVGRKEI